MDNRMRSLSFAEAGVGFLALRASTPYPSQRHWLKELSGPAEKLTITISKDLNPCAGEIVVAKGFPEKRARPSI